MFKNFHLRPSQLIVRSARCNGFYDCMDRSDESGCQKLIFDVFSNPDPDAADEYLQRALKIRFITQIIDCHPVAPEWKLSTNSNLPSFFSSTDIYIYGFFLCFRL
jgi:hypothetical protein